MTTCREDLLTGAQVARRYGFGRSAVYNAMARGRLIPAEIIGGREFFDEAAIEQWRRNWYKRLNPEVR